MCGISGFWNLDKDKNFDESTLKKMSDVLEHRGPDGRGYHFDPSLRFGMAHNRLAIIGLESGQQPILDSGGQHVLCANAEFYDYKKIRGKLVSEGEAFTTKSDCEIALKLYKAFGLDFLDHLRGEFAFALFDKKKQELLLVRDRFGIRPLYYYNDPQKILFASEIKSLLASEHIVPEIDAKASLHQLMQVMVPGQTLFKDIKALLPGHVLRVKKTATGLSYEDITYWDMQFPEDGQHSTASEETIISELRDQLIESIALRLEADVPVACYLSGGIDSCSILGLASAIQQSPVKGFTISFDDNRFDEAQIAKEMALSCKAEQDILKVSSHQLYGEQFEKALWHSERTFYNTLGVAKMLMSQHVVNSGYKVVITGEGSDELFGGYAAFKRDMLLHDPDSQNSKGHLSQLQSNNQIFQGSILAEHETRHPAFEDLMGFTPSWIQPWILTHRLAKDLLKDSFLEEIGDYDPFVAIAESLSPKALQHRHPLDQSQYTWIKTMLEGQILNWGGDRVDMAHSLESRPAFLDHKVAEFAAQIPPKLRIQNGIEKWVLREAMKHILPEKLYRREKFAFMAPPAHTHSKKTEALSALLDKHLSQQQIDSSFALQPESWNQFLTEYRTSKDSSYQTRCDIIINHMIQLHALKESFCGKAN
ncbi:MAG: asparagine synthase (glutamine-hydrolyzing) [Bdellovibrionales bacterium]|nr:asparagine synthase (glutamine-hydrolyzing) [Bdellovibrionales bacterium]